MISRSAVSRAGQLALRRQSCAQAQSRGFAAAASSPAAFEPTEVSGVAVVAKDAHGPSTKLAIVAKAGTRYQPAPGLTAGLEAFAFKVRPTTAGGIGGTGRPGGPGRPGGGEQVHGGGLYRMGEGLGRVWGHNWGPC
jgi:hypothetical protein